MKYGGLFTSECLHHDHGYSTWALWRGRTMFAFVQLDDTKQAIFLDVDSEYPELGALFHGHDYRWWVATLPKLSQHNI